MRRYYSHYTFISPSTYLQNYIVEVNHDMHIVRIFPYTHEIEKTEFYSGLLIFTPIDDTKQWDEYPTDTNRWSKPDTDTKFITTDAVYKVIYKGRILK